LRETGEWPHPLAPGGVIRSPHKFFRIACCGICLDARGFTKEQLIAEAARSRPDELADWTVGADRVLTF